MAPFRRKGANLLCVGAKYDDSSTIYLRQPQLSAGQDCNRTKDRHYSFYSIAQLYIMEPLDLGVPALRALSTNWGEDSTC
jgi:hypothetical protein